MYFAQTTAGQITNVWYNTQDSPYFVHVKSSVINAFQTRIVARNAQASFQEDDLVGQHSSDFAGSSKASSLLITKTFSQSDFTAFADPAVNSHTVAYTAQATHTVHPAGYFQAATMEHYVVLSDISQGASKKVRPARDQPDMSGFDMTMSSKGNMMLGMIVSILPLQSRFGEDSGLPSAMNGQDYTQTTLRNLGVNGAALSSARSGIRDVSAADVQETIATTASLVTAPADLIQSSQSLRRAAKFLTVNGVSNVFRASLEQALANAKSVHAAQGILYLLSNVLGDAAKVADEILLARVWSRQSEWQTSSVFALSTSPASRSISHEVVSALISVVELDTELTTDLARQTVLALGVALGRTEPTRAEAAVVLRRLFQSVSADADTILLLNAIANAGSEAARVLSLRELALPKFLEHENDAIRVAVLRLAEQYPIDQSILIISHFATLDDSAKVRALAMRAYAKHVREFADVDTLAREVASLSALATEDSQFPFNRSYTGSSTFGGDWLGVTFAADFFVGSNFDCQQPNFNYKVFGDVSASINLLKFTQQALEGQILYGKVDGSVIGNDMFLSVWGKTVWEKQLPTVDCSEHTYPLYHTAPGFDKSYTIWVTIVPVTFTVGVDLVVNVNWGWQICDAQLSALVELIPSASLVASASAETDLLIIYAGAALDASFNAVVRPQAYVHGSQCNVGVDAVLQTQPMSALFKGYYKKQVCKLWIFDCHWGEMSTQNFWTWALPSQSKVLFNEQLNIH